MPGLAESSAANLQPHALRDVASFEAVGSPFVSCSIVGWAIRVVGSLAETDGKQFHTTDSNGGDPAPSEHAWKRHAEQNDGITSATETKRGSMRTVHPA